ncbi:MAG: hypothetical protein OEU59_04520, partial [Gammaproteobacteria bacterium]|nr:hypothetical protein [Gammaproteobacteria bacterium]
MSCLTLTRPRSGKGSVVGEDFPQAGTGPVQPGFYRADRRAGKLMNFIDFIALSVVEEHDDTVFIAEFCEREVERPELLEALVVTNGVLITGESVQALGREKTFLDSVHSAPRKTPPLVDEEVVHDTGQPRPRRVNGDEV